ncbi:rho GTPase-activating 29 isoform X1 [Olea europaea subsp. europaea]|uniref:Rho GTPase-activating 29 isoform X1 n=1 Tax=Olea europaea subsp. europaea TaxID=158383 RepID=A0A8S0TNI7_OLEEU|nr:rho GTPase-activating 29 isoform X1 [Olea europaea subsp. europaea]
MSQHAARQTTSNENSSSATSTTTRLGRDERRSSVAAENVIPAQHKQQQQTSVGRADPRKPLSAVMSEDYLTSAPFLNRFASSPETTASIASTAVTSSTNQKLSFLSKFARSEVKTSKSIDKSHTSGQQQQQQQQLSSKTTGDFFGAAAAGSARATSGAGGTSTRANNENDDSPRTRSLDKNEKIEGASPPEAGRSHHHHHQTQSDKRKQTNGSAEHSTRDSVPAKSDKDEEAHDDDDNQVLPAWPSRIEAAAALEPALVQHQVYSLKDYSQVSGPSEPAARQVASSAETKTATTTATATGGARGLQKSMSQDRKVGSRNKRMSECTLTGAASMDAKTASSGRQRRLPSMISGGSGGGGKISGASPGQVVAGSGTGSSTSAAMGPAASVNSLLLPATAATATTASGKTSSLAGESRIDRMRKLFVSPLSLRGSTGVSSAKSATATGTPSTHSRLSLQAGANMLNKPHHLMHMYRARVGAGGHHASRRSPMRQKQATMKGFRVYGCPLSMANTMYPITCFGRPDIYKQQAVPYILARLCNYIEENSSQLTHEGIFRVSGNARLMEKLKTLFDHLGDAPLESESVDVATSASMLKMYLRELPEPLIPTRMNYYFFTLAKKYQSLLFKSGGGVNGFRVSDNMITTTMTSSSAATGGIANEPSSISDGQSTLDRHRLAFMRDLTKLIRKLPIENYNLLKYLACFLHRISLKQNSNKMSAEALGIVFGPNVFRIRSESYKGLKEQELSNQIMASIISNYKQLFDCELTDPLGNLVKSDEFLNLSGLSATRESLSGPADQTGGSRIASGEVGALISTAAAAAARGAPAAASASSSSAGPPTTVPHPAPATPSSDSALHQHQHQHHHHGHTRASRGCPSHGHAPARVHYQHSDEGEDSDDEDATNPDDDECDDDGSYSPSSGSGSYCSSLASDSAGSTYEGDVEAERGYDEDDEDDDDDEDDELDDDEEEEDEDEFARANSDTSSECASETSYTPSSSHSDSDVDDAEGAELSSSNFSSNPSLAGLALANEETNEADVDLDGEHVVRPAAATAPSHRPCQVCKRRESAHLEQANKLQQRDNLQLHHHQRASHHGPTSGPARRSDLPKHGEVEGKEPAADTEDQLSVRPAGRSAAHGMSTRRKRAAAPAAVEGPPSRRQILHTPGQGQQQLALASSDFALHLAAAEQRQLEEPKTGPAERLLTRYAGPSAASQPSSNTLGQPPPPPTRQAQQPRKPGLLLRRRSSSASSLLRIARHRTGDGGREHLNPTKPRHGSTRSEAHKRCQHAARGSERHQTGGAVQPSARAFNRKSRSKSHHSHNHSHHYHHSASSKRGDPVDAQQQVRAQQQQPPRWRRPDWCVPAKLLAMNLSPEDRRDLVWEYISANLLAEMGSPPPSSTANANEMGERFFAGQALRSYNSDETLMRSQAYHLSSASAAAAAAAALDPSQPAAASGAQTRRRFSGQDHLQFLQEQQDLLASAYDNEFGQIFETLEGGDAHAAAATAAAQPGLVGELVGLQVRAAAGPRVDSSVISLLGCDQMLSFRHSTLSLTDQEQLSAGLSDPIVAQLKVTRDLVRVLQKLTKYGAANGFSQDLSAYLLEFLSDLGQAEDELNSDAELSSSSCYIDHLTGRTIVSALDSLKRDVDDLPKVDLVVQARLLELLGAKIAELKKRYNNLKYIREHYHRHHTMRRRQKSEAEPGRPKSPTDTSGGGGGATTTTTTDQDRHSVGSEQDVHSLELASTSSMSQSLRRQAGEGENAAKELSRPTTTSGSCKFGSLCPVEFVFNIEKRLASRRQSGSRQVRLNDMTLAQLQSEKLELQKNLLRYEHWFGRPASRSEFNLVGHLYERYRAVKIIKQRKQGLSD